MYFAIDQVMDKIERIERKFKGQVLDPGFLAGNLQPIAVPLCEIFGQSPEYDMIYNFYPCFSKL